MCSIDYPYTGRFRECRVCGEKTSFFSTLPSDPDWADAVRLAKGITDKDLDADARRLAKAETDYAGIRDRHDPSLSAGEYWWRAKEMYAAGWPYDFAFKLAARRDIDLHLACDLVKRAGVDLALQILD